MFRKSKDYSSNGDEIVCPDPFTRVRTAAAKTETTNTTVQNATIIDENSKTVKYQTTRQTVTHQQQARITEINTVQYSPDKDEIEKLLAELNIGNADPKKSRLQQMFDSHSPFATPKDNAKKLPPLKTEKTIVTQKSGSKVTSMTEEHRIRLNNGRFFHVNNETINKSTNRPNDYSVSSPQRPIISKADFSSGQKNSFPQHWEAKKLSTPMSRITSNVPSQTSPKPSFSASAFLKVPPKSIVNTSTKIAPTRKLKEVAKPPIFPSTQPTQLGAIPKTITKVTTPTTTTTTPKLSTTHQKSALKPGLAFVFNNENFDGGRNVSRIGTDADANALVATFKMFNLTVEVHKDATLTKIKTVVRSIINKDFRKYSCLVIAILTHGSRNEMVQARDKPYSIDDDILFPIMKNPSLTEKPKILFIQACKGFMEIEDFHRDQPQLHGVPSEILKCYSTFEGYVSYRTEQGTFFIQKLCEELKKSGKSESIEVIMRSVTAAVKQFTGGKQIPTMTVNLTEPFIFGDYI